MIFAEINQWHLIAASMATAVIAVVSTFSAGIRKVIMAWFDKQSAIVMRGKYGNGIQRMAEFHEIIELFRPMKFVDRVLLFKGSNCGGMPDPKRKYTVQCFFGWSSDPNKHPEEIYNFPLNVDRHYMAMLGDIIGPAGNSLQVTSKMPVDAKLRNYYMTEGVVCAGLYFLCLDENELMYMSIASYATEFSPAQLMQIELVIARAQSCLTRTS